jgi:transmembrane sensor
MRHSESTNGRPSPSDLSMHAEAGEWLHRLLDTETDPEEPYPDPVDRQNAFFAWLSEDPARARAFYEMMEFEARVGAPDPQRLINIQTLLESAPANVIQLYERPNYLSAPASSAAMPGRGARAWYRRPASIAAGVALCIISIAVYLGFPIRNVYATSIGEQRTCKLNDGSVMVLNTDTQVQVDFSKAVREVRLVKGEALFMVEHDAARPFVVVTGNAKVRAVGTEFNVRQRGDDTTDVAVVEGIVQVSTDNMNASGATPSNTSTQPVVAPSTPATALRLAAGENARVSGRTMKVSAKRNVADVLAWRQRRLTFDDTSLADVAAEFNRYNHSQIRVEGAARDILMTGIFDADHPQAIILFAQKNDGLAVQQDGNNWVIRARE